MRRRLRLLLVPILAVALPLVALAAIGYQWLTLDREAAARRTQDAAGAEAAGLRAALLDRMAAAAAEVDRHWPAGADGRPFALRPRPHPLITDAYRFTADGQLDEPDYDKAYQRLVHAAARIAEGTPDAEAASAGPIPRDTRTAFSLLDVGRRALGARRPASAVASAAQILGCCAAARDEFGVALAVLAARQMAAAWRQQNALAANLPGLMARLSSLIDRGAIGHPSDIVDLAGFVRATGDAVSGRQLLARAQASADAVTRVMSAARRLEAWLAASGRSSPADRAFEAAPINLEGRDVVGGRLRRPGGGDLVVLFDLAALSATLAGGRPGALFEGALVTDGSALDGQSVSHVPLLADLPEVQIAVRPRPGDAATQQRRTTLFAAALLAALALTLVVAYLGFRDVAREVSLASQQASFVASVSHELKTPVASIRLLAETLRMRTPADGTATAALLDEIREQADRQARLIDNVLGVARIDRDLPMYQPVDVDVTKVVEQALERLDYLLRQEGFTVRRDFPDGPLRASVDPDGLMQAVTNLVTNAVKYSGRCREITLTVDRDGSETRLRVADGGIGIEPAEQKKIFDRFYRTEAATRESGGTGLGLALVRHFAESHGGSVCVDSAPGRGSTFTLRLPALAGIASNTTISP